MKTEETNTHIGICDYIKLQYPNVVFTSESSGIRVGMKIAKQLKRQRSVGKLPDLIILEPRGGYSGLILEIKKNRDEIYTKAGRHRTNKHLQKQARTISLLAHKGYSAMFVCGFDEAKAVIDKYMKL